MKKKKWLFIIFVIAVAAFSLFLFLQSKPSDQELTEGSSSLPALSFPVEREDIANTVDIKGKTSYAEETWIYAPFSSKVKQWQVEEGQSVKKDTVLFELENEKLRNEISLAEAQLLKQQFTNKISEIGSKSITMDTEANETEQGFDRFTKKEELRLQQQLDKIQLSITELELNDKKNQLKQSVYTSPESGIFLFSEQQKPISVDQDIALGKIVELSSLQLLCTVTEYDIFRIKVGMEVEIRIEANKNMKVKGIVEHVSRFAKTGTNPASSAAQFEVRISLEKSSELIAGLSLTGKIVTDSKKATLVVPTLAVMREDEQYFVYVTTPSGVEKRIISIGLETAEKTEILKGLAEGDTVVLQ